jgi:protein-tyrosine phosphatase
MITQITKRIALGSASDVNEENIKRFEFDCVLNVNETEFPEEKELLRRLKIHYEWSPIPKDRAENETHFKEDIRAASAVLHATTYLYKRILVHCLDSIDRAPLVVALFIADRADLTIPQAYDIVRHRRKWIREHYEWV